MAPALRTVSSRPRQQHADNTCGSPGGCACSDSSGVLGLGTPPSFGSIPETWVTLHSGDMGNSFGPKGFSIGSSQQVSSSKYPSRNA